MRALAATFLSALQALERLRDVAAVQAQQALVTAVVVIAVIAAGGELIAVLGVSRRRRCVRAMVVEKAESGLARPIEFRLRNAVVRWRSSPASPQWCSRRPSRTSIRYSSMPSRVTETRLYGAAYRILLALFHPDRLQHGVRAFDVPPSVREPHGVHVAVLARRLPHVGRRTSIALYGLVGSHVLLDAVYGEPYGDADGALALLLLSGVFTFPAWIASTTAYAAGAERRIVAIVAASLTFNVAANLLAIPAWGIEGAAAINASRTEALTFALLLFVLERAGVRLEWFAALGKLIAIAGGSNRRTGFPAVPLAVRLVFGSAAYVVALLLLRTFDAQDSEFLRGLAQSRGSGRRRRRAMIGPYGFSTRAQTATVKYGSAAVSSESSSSLAANPMGKATAVIRFP